MAFRAQDIELDDEDKTRPIPDDVITELCLRCAPDELPTTPEKKRRGK